MCRWGCDTTNTTFMCKWCGTWFCRECLRGAFRGLMSEPLKCRVCFQKHCQGTRVDVVTRPTTNNGNPNGNKTKGDNIPAGRERTRSALPSKSRGVNTSTVNMAAKKL